MINIPERVNFKFQSKTENVSNILVFFILKSKFKNDFSLEPLVTNENGEVFFYREAAEKSISATKINFPMDYKGGLSDCVSLHILIENKEYLRKRVARLEEFYPEKSSQLLFFVNNSSNSFNFSLNIQLPIKSSEVVVNIAN